MIAFSSLEKRRANHIKNASLLQGKLDEESAHNLRLYKVRNFFLAIAVIVFFFSKFVSPYLPTAEQDSARQSSTAPWVEIFMTIMNLNLKPKLALR